MKFLIICRRELSSYFSSFIAYILIAVFLLLSGYFFYSDLIFFILFGGFVLPSGLWQFVFLDMRLVALLVLPLVTMRLFAEEKKLGTMELLWTYPVRDGEIVAGKFLAAWLFFLLMLLPTVVNALIFYQFHAFEVGPLAAAYVGRAEQRLAAADDLVAAAADLEQALAFQPESPEAQRAWSRLQLYRQGDAALARGDWESAVAQLSDLHSEAPRYLESLADRSLTGKLFAAWLGWGRATLAAGDGPNAALRCAQALALVADDPEALRCAPVSTKGRLERKRSSNSRSIDSAIPPAVCRSRLRRTSPI